MPCWGINLGHHFVRAPAKFPSDLSTNFFEKYYHTRNCVLEVHLLVNGQHVGELKSPYFSNRWRDDCEEFRSIQDNGEIK